jgi:hypothetical protein
VKRLGNGILELGASSVSLVNTRTFRHEKSTGYEVDEKWEIVNPAQLVGIANWKEIRTGMPELSVHEIKWQSKNGRLLNARVSRSAGENISIEFVADPAKGLDEGLCDEVELS